MITQDRGAFSPSLYFIVGKIKVSSSSPYGNLFEVEAG